MTAGDLIRQALDEGETKLGLAKKLAGTPASTDPDVGRWRYVVKRAAEGGEPQEPQATRIAEFFGVTVDRPRLGPRRDRLRALEEEVGKLTRGLDAVRRANRNLLRRVEALEGAAQSRPAGQGTHRARTAP